MTYETFKTVIVERLQEDIPDPKEISIHQIRKNNGLLMDGLVIMEKDINISPTLYLNYYYESYRSGASFHQIYDLIMKTYQNNKPSGQIDINFFTSFENIQSKIVFKLINYEKNKTLLKDIPYIPYLDLAIVFYCLFDMDSSVGNASILIHNSHLETWDTTIRELYELAFANTYELLPPYISPLSEVLKKMAVTLDHSETISDIAENESGMYIMSNTPGYQGACSILYLNMLKEFADRKQTDLFIIPSSIHEVILVPASQITAEELTEMIRDVNHTQLEPEEILSDHPYYYSRVTNVISCGL